MAMPLTQEKALDPHPTPVDSWTIDDLDLIVETHGPTAAQILAALRRRLADILPAGASIDVPEGMPPSLQVTHEGPLLTVEVTTATGDAVPVVPAAYYWRIEMPPLAVSLWRRQRDGGYAALGRSAERLSVTEPCALEIPLSALLADSLHSVTPARHSRSGRRRLSLGTGYRRRRCNESGSGRRT